MTFWRRLWRLFTGRASGDQTSADVGVSPAAAPPAPEGPVHGPALPIDLLVIRARRGAYDAATRNGSSPRKESNHDRTA